MNVNTQTTRVLLLGATAILFLQWLKSQPRCARGCQTQLEHLQEHIFEDVIRALLA